MTTKSSSSKTSTIPPVKRQREDISLWDSPTSGLETPDWFGVRDYQNHAVGKIKWDIWGNLVVAPMGSGKTAMGLMGAARWQRSHERRDTVVVWITLRRKLLSQVIAENYALSGAPIPEQFEGDMDQWKEAFEAWKDAGGLPLVENLVPISAFATKIPDFGDRPVMVITDEAHHNACNTILSLLGKIEPEAHLGLSATPMRSDRAVLGFQRNIIEADYDILIRDKYLSQYDLYKTEWAPKALANTLMNYRERWGKSLMFFKNSDDLNTFYDCLPKAQQAKTVIIKAGYEAEQLERFETGDADLALNLQILTEGFNCPSIKTVWCWPTQSKTLSIQMAGRVLRLFEGQRKQIVQDHFSPYHFMHTAKPECIFSELNGGGGWEDETKATKELKTLIIPNDQLVRMILSRNVVITDKEAKEAAAKNRFVELSMGSTLFEEEPVTDEGVEIEEEIAHH